MALAQEDIELIEGIVKKAIDNSPEVRNGNVRYELDLRERTIRVEEELKHQRELMIQGFAQMDKRFEQVDKRFESIQMEMNKRFEQVESRFQQSDKHFESLTKRLDRFMFWSLGLTISSAIFIVNFLK